MRCKLSHILSQCSALPAKFNGGSRKTRLSSFSLTRHCVTLLLSFIAHMACGDTVLSDDQATPEARQAFQSLNHSKHILQPGEFGGFSGAFDRNRYRAPAPPTDRSQTAPRVYACDYGLGWVLGSTATALIDFSCNQSLIDQYRKHKVLAQISLHLPNPVMHTGGGLRVPISNEAYRQLLTIGHPFRNRWLQTLDVVAAGLADLQQHHTPVLLKPLHQMNGEWFWWGNISYNSDNAERQALYKELYIDVYRFLTQEKGLHNLIWVYAPSINRQALDNFYPGDAYVDVVGLETQAKLINTSRALNQYSKAQSLGKPLAFTEIALPQESNRKGFLPWQRQLHTDFSDVRYFVLRESAASLSLQIDEQEAIAPPSL